MENKKIMKTTNATNGDINYVRVNEARIEANKEMEDIYRIAGMSVGYATESVYEQARMSVYDHVFNEADKQVQSI